MMFEVDVKNLVENLKNLEKAEDVGLSDGAQYLLEQVYHTLIRDESLTVGEIDFSRFTCEELQEFTDYLKCDLHSKTGKIESVRELFAEHSPKVVSQRVFF